MGLRHVLLSRLIVLLICWKHKRMVTGIILTQVLSCIEAIFLTFIHVDIDLRMIARSLTVKVIYEASGLVTRHLFRFIQMFRGRNSLIMPLVKCRCILNSCRHFPPHSVFLVMISPGRNASSWREWEIFTSPTVFSTLVRSCSCYLLLVLDTLARSDRSRSLLRLAPFLKKFLINRTVDINLIVLFVIEHHQKAHNWHSSVRNWKVNK